MLNPLAKYGITRFQYDTQPTWARAYAEFTRAPSIDYAMIDYRVAPVTIELRVTWTRGSMTDVLEVAFMRGGIDADWIAFDALLHPAASDALFPGSRDQTQLLQLACVVQSLACLLVAHTFNAET